MKSRKIAYIILAFYFIVMLSLVWVTFYFVPVSAEFEVDAEYINSILTASSILYGFWMVLMQMKSTKKISLIFSLGALFVLAFSVLVTYLNAIGFVPDVLALYSCMISFLWNTAMLSAVLYRERYGD